tara:strand:- start:929 stop:2707 length:1779 start_codon:yes stop_codon:yes gene_type:complete
MKKALLSLFFLGITFCTSSQEKKPTKKANIKIDTVKTEVVEVITKYNPKIADASKIKTKPTVELLSSSQKKKLNYSIFSAPVASTFIPKSGVVKGVNVGNKENIYNNFIAAGYGNYNSPYIEAYLHSYTRFQSEFGVSTKYEASLDNIENTALDSDFSNFDLNVFFKKEERYFDWKITLNSERNQYNWYGIQEEVFNQNTIDNINSQQTYNYFNLKADIDFLDAYVSKTQLSVAYYNDAFNSNEYLIDLNTNFDFPLNSISSNLNNLLVKTNLIYLGGDFESGFQDINTINYSIFTTKINSEYNTTFGGFSLKLGTSFFAAFDTENNVNHFLLYPDIKLQKSILKDKLNIYTGVFGDLKTNSYKSLSEENPFISPTQFITQTAEKYNIFLGTNGVLNNNFSFNFSASIKEEQDKPFFIKNYSKSNGTNTSNGVSTLKGFEYGNSFSVVYDDVKTTSFLAELEYEFTKTISFLTNFQFDNFSLTSQSEAWNLPTLQGSVISKYKSKTWYANAAVFYVGDRKEVSYSGTSFNSNGTLTIDSFVDINIDGGYHFSDKFSVFLKLNNILNNNYQRFADLPVQGFQVLGGLTYKFDF